MVENIQSVGVRERTRVWQPELNAVPHRHELYRAGKPGGRRAVLTYRDLSGLDLAARDLSGADLVGCDLCDGRLAEKTLGGELKTIMPETGTPGLAAARMAGANLSRAPVGGGGAAYGLPRRDHALLPAGAR